MKSRFLLLLLAIYVVQNVNSQIIYVNENASGTNNGSTWINAYTDLQDALSAASYGDTIAVAGGTYIPSSTDRDVSFSINDGFKLFGGFAGDETNISSAISTRDFETNATILSGDINEDDGSNFTNYGDNSYHVVKFSPSAGLISDETVLDGFTISGGNADGSLPDDRGAGIYFDNSTNKTSSPILKNLIVENNLAKSGGGIAILPIYGDAEIQPVFLNITVQYNKAAGEIVSSGGGLYIMSSSPVLFNAKFIGNTAEGTNTSYGGAIYNSSQNTGDVANMVIVNGLFVDNYSGDFGGAIYNKSGNSDGIQTSETAPTLTNCTFYSNEDGSSSLGQAISNMEYNSSTCFVTIQNSILWDNGTYQVSYHYSDDGRPSVTFKNCVVQNSSNINFETLTQSTGNVNLYATDPLFAHPDTLNFRIENFTDSGNDSFLPSDMFDLDNDDDVAEYIPFDIEGNARIMGANVAIGAFETVHDKTPPTFSEVSLNKSGFAAGDPIIITAELTESGATVTTDLSYLDSDLPADAAFSENEPGVYTYTSDPLDNGGNMQEGTFKLYIHAEDLHGNATIDSSQTVTLDKTFPTFVNASVGSDTVFRAGQTITFSVDMAESGLTVYADLSTIDESFGDSIAFTDNNDGTYSYTTDALDNSGEIIIGDVNITIHAVDNVGNTTSDNSLWLVIAKLDGYFVKASATGLNNGTSWDNAFTTLQAAIAVAESGNKIYVAAGTYRTESNLDRANSFLITEKVELYGGFTGDEEEITQDVIDSRDWETNETILSGDGAANDETGGDNSDNSYHVVTVENEVKIDGFTIRDGNANGSEYGQDRGGGIYTYTRGFYDEAIPNIRNCKIIYNKSAKKAGGIYIESNGSIEHCLIARNEGESGGAIYQDDRYGNLQISNSSICHNTATDLGGGYAGFSYSSDNACTAKNTIIAYNKAGNIFYCDINGYISTSYCLIGPYIHKIKDQGNNIICEEEYVNGSYVINYPVKFVDTTALDYRLYSNSNLVGGGDPEVGSNIGFYQGTGVASSDSPSISITGSLTDFESTEVNHVSTEQNFTVSGENLKGDIKIIPPSGFEVSLNSGSSFAAEDTISLNPTDGYLTATIINIRFAPTEAKVYSDSVTIFTELDTAYVKVQGTTGSQANPIISIEGSLSNFYTNALGEKSSEQNISISGYNLTENIQVTAPQGFEISLGSGEGFIAQNPLSLVPVGNSVNETIYVRFAPVEDEEYSGKIEVTTSSEKTDIPVRGYVQSQNEPMIFIEGHLTNFDSTYMDHVSPEQSFSVSGINLEDDIQVVAPEGFEISLGYGEGFIAEDTITITPEENTVNEVDIYIRFTPESEQDYSGAIILTSTSVEEVNVNVFGPIKFHSTTSISATVAKTFDFDVFPNPASDFVNIRFNETVNKNTYLSIFRFNGELIHTQKVDSDIVNLDISNYKPGIYIIKINKHFKKFIID